MLQAIALVMLGGALGAASRYLVTHFTSNQTHHSGFPIGTLMVNVIGSLLVGYALTWSADHAHDRWRLLAATGFCGGFTTFSAYAFESMDYWRQGQMMTFAINVVANNVLSFLALIAGVAMRNGRGQ